MKNLPGKNDEHFPSNTERHRTDGNYLQDSPDCNNHSNSYHNGNLHMRVLVGKSIEVVAQDDSKTSHIDQHLRFDSFHNNDFDP